VIIFGYLIKETVEELFFIKISSISINKKGYKELFEVAFNQDLSQV
jgi:hypothetical protein